MSICRIFFQSAALIAMIVGLSAQSQSQLTEQQRSAVDARMKAYVKATGKEDWKALFSLVSDVGRGGVDENTFVRALKYAHVSGTMPDLQAFAISRVLSDSDGTYILFGCGRARREGREFNGVASARIVFEHGDWFITGWTFTGFPNRPCTDLSDPNWKPASYDAVARNAQMQELKTFPK